MTVKEVGEIDFEKGDGLVPVMPIFRLAILIARFIKKLSSLILTIIISYLNWIISAINLYRWDWVGYLIHLQSLQNHQLL